MKKNAIKAFTLVEMLIVIVIIGILIASLMPRMSAAQGRARDVARKNDLNQVQTAIIAYQGDHSRLPGVKSDGTDETTTLIPLKTASSPNLADAIKTAGGMSDVPHDPQAGATINGYAGTNNANAGEYLYKVLKRAGVANAGFILVSHVEIAGSANYVMDGSTDQISKGKLQTATDGIKGDSANIILCDDIVKSTAASCAIKTPTSTDDRSCEYCTDDQLVYVLAY